MDNQKITAMRAGGKILGNLLKDLKDYVQPGMTELEIDAWVRQEITKRGAEVAYDMLDDDFPGAICISTNEELVHGAPTDYELQEGDVVSFDLDIYYQGYFTDSAFTMIVGGDKAGSAAERQMLRTTKNSLMAGIQAVKAGVDLGTVGHAVEKVLKKGKFGVIKNYIGHGIGKTMHEAPEVPNYGKPGRGYVLKAGDTICIEPMASLGKPANHIEKSDGWSVILNDGLPGCHFEHTILVTEKGAEILTLAD